MSETPEVPAQLDRWATPSSGISIEEIAKGTIRLEELLPKYEEIPEDFKRGNNTWVGTLYRWRYSKQMRRGRDDRGEGIPTPDIPIKPNINPIHAAMHLMTLMRTKVEETDDTPSYKEAALAWLMSRWCTEPNLGLPTAG